MKKLLIGTAAISLGVFGIAGQAKAEGLKLNLAGHFKGYVDYLSQDNDTTNADGTKIKERKIDILRETELHFTGETTLDNGLTVGFHDEVDVDGTDGGADGLYNEESYLYFSGAWGRVNFGKEDGAAYLLQVAAPSADSNYDGLRQYVSPFVFGLEGNDSSIIGATAGAAGDIATIMGYSGRFDYDEAISGNNNKITYLSPVFSGFQAGISYTPEVNGGASNDFGNSTNNVIDDYGSAWDLGVRWEGQWNELGIALGGGWSRVNLEHDDSDSGSPSAGTGNLGDLDERTAWDLGIDLNWGAFGIGAAYLRDDLGIDSVDGGVTGGDLAGRQADQKTWTIGADYTTGPFKIGGSYYRQSQELAGLDSNGISAATLGTGGGEDVNGSMKTTRWTGGVVYTYGPGMTFRGSVSHINVDLPASADGEDFSGTTVLLGTQVDF